MLGIAAIVLFCIAAIIYFSGHIGISAAGLACVGLACLAAHLLLPLAPWRHQ